MTDPDDLYLRLAGDHHLDRLIAEDTARQKAARARAAAQREDPPERLILKQIMRALEADGVLLFRYSAGLMEKDGRKISMCQPGHSDLAGIVTLADGTGRPLYLEVKTSSGRATEQQRHFLALVRKHGAWAYVVRSVEEARRAVQACKAGERSP